MSRTIDPRVDCVFKAILGAPENASLLLHFLSAVLKPPPGQELRHVELLNPFNEKEFASDKLSVVDVCARDNSGRIFQIEVQLAVTRRLVPRILYGFCDLVSSQLTEGAGYERLAPAVSIWILSGVLFKHIDACHHRFGLNDPATGATLDERFQIHILELSRFGQPPVHDELHRWAWFFRFAGSLSPEDALPDVLNTPEMRRAMTVLKRFSEQEADYQAYRARMDYLRQLWDIEAAEKRWEAEQKEREAEQKQWEAEQKQWEADQRQWEAEQKQWKVERATLAASAEEHQRSAEQARRESAEAHAEVERLRALLAQRAAGA